MPRPSLADTTRVFTRIGVLSFGGPAAQIALMHRELVEKHHWLKENQFLNALSFCMLLPGPEAMQLATYAGWRLHGTLGGLIAGLLFVIPGAFVVLALASIYAYFGEVPLVNALFLGIKATVLVIVIEALLRVSKKALNGAVYWGIALLSFIGIFFLALPYPLIVLLAGLIGVFLKPGTIQPIEEHHKTSFTDTLKTILLWLVIWWGPILFLGQASDLPILTEIGAFFSRLAVVTFGGAYAVLAYMGQDVVTNFGWLTAGEMMDGLGLAETTPGPLILVTEFVGFLAAFHEGGFWLGIAGAIVTLWVTFTPCFLWIFAGAPYIDRLSGLPRLRGTLSAITAAVVGVILNLSIWFGLHVFFADVTRNKVGIITLWQPTLSSLEPVVVVLALLSGVLLLRFHMGLLKVLTLSAIGGLALSFVM